MPEPYLDSTMGLVSPFAGVHNLDLSPEAFSDVSGSRQLWGLPTPSDGPFASSISDTDLPIIRVYRNEEDITNAYYIYIHPYLPLLPAAISPQYEDQSSFIQAPGESNTTELKKTDLPYWPESSLSLALSALLVLIPPSHDQAPTKGSTFAARRAYAQLFAQSALSKIEQEIDDLGPPSSVNLFVSTDRGNISLHPDVPIQLDPILALVTLAVYEYVQRGNVSRMRARINQAVTTAMDISLHTLGVSSSESPEAHRRAWWMTMFIAYLSSNLHLAPPVIAANDSRITTPFPQFGVHLEPFDLLMKAQTTLFASHQMAQKIEKSSHASRPPNIGDEISSLDALTVSLMTESDRCLRTTFGSDYEEQIAENLWRIGRINIYTARIRLHRFRAFMDIPLFLDKYCDLTSINSHGLSSTPSPAWVTERETSFPFTEEESSNICLKACLVVSTMFRNLPYPSQPGLGPFERRPAYKTPHTIPYFACSAMQSCYTLLMLLHKVRACLATDRLGTCYHLLNKPEPATEASDAERLAEELRRGVECLGASLKSDIIFEGVGGMGHEIESAYLAAFPECHEI
ncbi:hypothetical protein N7532_005447 [Penicillium argentinense]|uniref:Transcription factor domain-containing protein n=1 Tax=Penicillium argentinense TaxID=1131581 RepID=A0A9W9KAE2_9EURO|nr:uncharacterized protein N7532_005447 [Penicillium argentinense]KAJ5098446.1 hypothetical protein N7532_005447 [Penicillium argentinense]